jgi:hypothetical protein
MKEKTDSVSIEISNANIKISKHGFRLFYLTIIAVMLLNIPQSTSSLTNNPKKEDAKCFMISGEKLFPEGNSWPAC